MRRVIFLSSLVLAAISVSGAVVGPSVISDLQSEKLQDRENARKQILENRKVLIEKLIELASEDRPGDAPGASRETKHVAIVLLGDLRATEAVGVLFDNLSYLNFWEPWQFKYADIGDGYPAAQSLVKIGMPAVPGCIERLKSSEDETIRKNCYWVIREVLGRELGRFIITKAVGAETDPEKRTRLQAALDK